MSRIQVQHVNKGIKGAVLNLPASSVNGVPRNMVHEIITVPSRSQPAWSKITVSLLLM